MTNTTKNAAGASADPALTAAPKPEDLKREQEKGKKDPVGKAEEIGVEKVKLVETEAHEPYPAGEEPDPEAAFVAAHGFRRAKE
jgi:hypothetical protein